jgi:2-polyprenyl-3-methyl-5-hydroxy-6-metoxy-1,4-benzoquinol methylase
MRNINYAHAKMIGLVGENKRVLDIGCSEGYISERLKQNNCTVVGVEVNPLAGEKAKKHCEDIIIGNIENIYEIDYPEGYFDVLLMGDVLEHLVDPKSVLFRSKSWLKDNGRIICSIPNVAHISNRMGLLLGKWEYGDTGILDNTHLRFFTRRSARNMIIEAGYRIKSETYSPWFWIPYFNLPSTERGANAENLITRIFPTLFACQFIIEAGKNNTN